MNRETTAIQIIPVTTADQMQAAMRVRRAVFVREQAVPESLEIDAYDGDPQSPLAAAVHVLAQVDGQTVGTGRLLLDAPAGGTAHIGRVAVLPSHRQQGVGNALMRALHDEAQARGFSGIAISAQTHALAFYQSLGYRAQGETYIEAGIEHQRMTREF